MEGVREEKSNITIAIMDSQKQGLNAWCITGVRLLKFSHYGKDAGKDYWLLTTAGIREGDCWQNSAH